MTPFKKSFLLAGCFTILMVIITGSLGLLTSYMIGRAVDPYLWEGSQYVWEGLKYVVIPLSIFASALMLPLFYSIALDLENKSV